MYFLRAENRRLFMEIIWWDFLRSRIFSPNDFFYALKAIDLTDIEKYFSLFTQQEVRWFITSDALFRKYLLKLSYSKQEPLLHFLGYDAKQYTFQPGNS
jgi:hypothetical protein